MRELKFRVWDKVNQQMFHMFPLETYIGCQGQLFFASNSKEKVKFDNLDINLVIQQYTGLKDSQGKEIYDGDVVEFWENSDWEGVEDNKHLALIEWGSYSDDEYVGNVECWMIKGHSPASSKWGVAYGRGTAIDANKGLKVIGNILETPEILSLYS